MLWRSVDYGPQCYIVGGNWDFVFSENGDMCDSVGHSFSAYGSLGKTWRFNLQVIPEHIYCFNANRVGDDEYDEFEVVKLVTLGTLVQ